MKHLKKFENVDIDPFGDDWDFEEDNGDVYKGDWVIFLPNPFYTHNNNFVVKEVLFVGERDTKMNYILVNSFDYDEKEKLIPLKNEFCYEKLNIGYLKDLKIGDYFFEKTYSRERHSVDVVVNKKMGGIVYDIQPLNYNGGKINHSDVFINYHSREILIPNEETIKILDKKIKRINENL